MSCLRDVKSSVIKINVVAFVAIILALTFCSNALAAPFTPSVDWVADFPPEVIDRCHIDGITPVTEAKDNRDLEVEIALFNTKSGSKIVLLPESNYELANINLFASGGNIRLCGIHDLMESSDAAQAQQTSLLVNNYLYLHETHSISFTNLDIEVDANSVADDENAIHIIRAGEVRFDDSRLTQGVRDVPNLNFLYFQETRLTIHQSTIQSAYAYRLIESHTPGDVSVTDSTLNHKWNDSFRNPSPEDYYIYWEGGQPRKAYLINLESINQGFNFSIYNSQLDVEQFPIDYEYEAIVLYYDRLQRNVNISKNQFLGSIQVPVWLERSDIQLQSDFPNYWQTPVQEAPCRIGNVLGAVRGKLGFYNLEKNYMAYCHQ